LLYDAKRMVLTSTLKKEISSAGEGRQRFRGGDDFQSVSKKEKETNSKSHQNATHSSFIQSLVIGERGASQEKKERNTNIDKRQGEMMEGGKMERGR